MSASGGRPVMTEADRMGCANCGTFRWRTPGASIVGGVHVCDTAIRQWIAADPGNPDLSIMALTEAQWGPASPPFSDVAGVFARRYGVTR